VRTRSVAKLSLLFEVRRFLFEVRTRRVAKLSLPKKLRSLLFEVGQFLFQVRSRLKIPGLGELAIALADVKVRSRLEKVRSQSVAKLAMQYDRSIVEW
jgi:hypothetical protein